MLSALWGLLLFRAMILPTNVQTLHEHCRRPKKGTMSLRGPWCGMSLFLSDNTTHIPRRHIPCGIMRCCWVGSHFNFSGIKLT